jgi:hypothetical protein
MNLVGNWNYPTTIRFGAGRISELGKTCLDLGLEAPLLVTDPGLASLPMVASVMERCQKDGLKIGIFSNVKTNPVEANVTEGVAAYRAGGHDGVIAFGGGSGLDVGKAIALMVGQDRPLWDFEDVGDWWTRANADGIAKIVAVPTTAGTGSEVGRASVITKEDTHEKKIVFHPRMMPSVVIADPELTVGLPAKLTAATGMDALAHNLEAFCAPGWHPMAAGIAVEGMRLIKDWLARAVSDGANIEARAQMLVASSMGATAFQRGLGAVHALSHPLGGLYDAHHGTLNAILMPYVLKANRPAIEDRIVYLARCLDVPKGFDGVLDRLVRLRAETAMPHTLKEIGIGDNRLAEIGVAATKDPSAGGNPIQFTAEEYAEIARKAVAGEL